MSECTCGALHSLRRRIDDSAYLVEASMEDLLHCARVECDSLHLSSLVFVVEGNRLAGG